MMHFNRKMLGALLATASLLALGACEKEDDHWVEDQCLEWRTCDPDAFSDVYDSIGDCVEEYGRVDQRYRSVGGDCPAAFHTVAECDLKQLCGETVDCAAEIDAFYDVCFPPEYP